jgi:hypothetical protein
MLIKQKLWFSQRNFERDITYECKYLGLIFASSGSLRQASANLEDKARKAYYSIKI